MEECGNIRQSILFLIFSNIGDPGLKSRNTGLEILYLGVAWIISDSGADGF